MDYKRKHIILFEDTSPGFEDLLKIDRTVILYSDVSPGEDRTFAIEPFKKWKKHYGIVSTEYGWTRRALGVYKILQYSVDRNQDGKIVARVALSHNLYKED